MRVRIYSNRYRKLRTIGAFIGGTISASIIVLVLVVAISVTY